MSSFIKKYKLQELLVLTLSKKKQLWKLAHIRKSKISFQQKQKSRDNFKKNISNHGSSWKRQENPNPLRIMIAWMPGSAHYQPVSTHSQPVSTHSQPVSTHYQPVSTHYQPSLNPSQPILPLICWVGLKASHIHFDYEKTQWESRYVLYNYCTLELVDFHK